MGRYDPLTTHLQQQSDQAVRLGFADIERIIGHMLPASALRQRSFWSNNAANNVMTRAWLAAGFRSEQVDLPSRMVVFRRQEAKVAGFEDARVPYETGEELSTGSFPLFGWMKGTITIAPGVDLTEPADPELGDLLDEFYGPPA